MLAWSSKVIESIGRKLKVVLGVGKETLEKEMLEYGRVFIQTKDFHLICKEIDLELSGVVLLVSIKEELMQPVFSSEGGTSARWGGKSFPVSPPRVRVERSLLMKELKKSEAAPKAMF